MLPPETWNLEPWNLGTSHNLTAPPRNLEPRNLEPPQSHGPTVEPGTSEPRNPRRGGGTWNLGMDSKRNRRAYGAPVEPGTWNLQEPTRRGVSRNQNRGTLHHGVDPVKTPKENGRKMHKIFFAPPPFSSFCNLASKDYGYRIDYSSKHFPTFSLFPLINSSPSISQFLFSLSGYGFMSPFASPAASRRLPV